MLHMLLCDALVGAYVDLCNASYFLFLFLELIALMKKLHEAFIALAAQLQQVNEAVKVCIDCHQF